MGPDLHRNLVCVCLPLSLSHSLSLLSLPLSPLVFCVRVSRIVSPLIRLVCFSLFLSLSLSLSLFLSHSLSLSLSLVSVQSLCCPFPWLLRSCWSGEKPFLH